MKLSFIILALSILPLSSFCTGQVPDYIIMGNDTLPIFSNPLEQYFDKIGTREIIDFSGCGSTACWRGYKAIWEMQNDSLFLIAITSCRNPCSNFRNANLKAMFGSDKVFADWYNGEIIIPGGELVRYVHMGYRSMYERELHLKLENGIKTKKKVISNKKYTKAIKFHNKEREISKAVQDTLFYYLQKNIEWDTLKTEWFNLCSDRYILTFSKRGKIKKTWIDWGDETFGEKIDDWWWNNTDDRKCRMTVKKAIKPLRLSYLEIPNKKFKITIDFSYDKETGKLKLWKDFWMENEK